MVATITDSSNDSSNICSIIVSENATTLTQIASSTEYAFASTDGTNLVLTSKTDSTQALYSISQNQFIQASGVYNSIALLSNGYVLLKQAVTTGDPNYDEYGYFTLEQIKDAVFIELDKHFEPTPLKEVV